ncbi:MAG: hypothetical protein RL088_884 [Verrucomicrobiota bacterium]
MSPLLQTISLLVLSNLFMTFAWYGHLKTLGSKPLWSAILVSWAIALAEYCFQVPANRIGYNSGISMQKLKIVQEVITLAVFVIFVRLWGGEKLKLDFLWAALCMCGAVYFVFRS